MWYDLSKSNYCLNYFTADVCNYNQDGNPLIPIWYKKDIELVRKMVPVLYGRIPIDFDIGVEKIVDKLVAISSL